ncbi:hypothetical protein KJ359_002917 [Pestalotiopsis sp. 9143b]|nr:hypothetical protein KJ359_002917 [Pestalotiopsis sp. 9143b]
MATQASKSDLPVDSPVAGEAVPPVQPDELPPSYEDTADNTAADQPISPITLILSGHHVVPVYSFNRDPQPLYELNRGVAVCTDATRSITFSRVDHLVRQALGGRPVVRERRRHLYDLEHDHPLPFAGRYVEYRRMRSSSRSGRQAVGYWCRSRSRQTAGDVGLQLRTSLLSSRSGAQVVRVRPEGGESEGRATARDGDEAETLFTAEWRRKGDVCTWSDASTGDQVALESCSGTEQHRLEVTSVLSREMLDMLVAVWCLRIWLGSAIKHEKGS